MASTDSIKDHLRGRLQHFINRREHAYAAIVKRNIPVPDYAEKMKAIKDIRIQLEASKDWSLRSHILWVCTMRSEIMLLLPYEFHDDPRQVTYRNKIKDLLAWCSDQLPTTQKKLFTQNQ